MATTIAQIIKRRKMTQAEAAKALGMTQIQLSDMLLGRFRNISDFEVAEYSRHFVQVDQDYGRACGVHGLCGPAQAWR